MELSLPGNPGCEEELPAKKDEEGSHSDRPAAGDQRYPPQQRFQLAPGLVRDGTNDLRVGCADEWIDRHDQQVDDCQCSLVIPSHLGIKQPSDPEQFAVPHDHVDRSAQIGADCKSCQFFEWRQQLE